MKARVPTPSAMQELQKEYDKALEQNIERATNNAIKLCVVTNTAALVDVGLAESTIEKIYKKWKSYIDSVRKGTVTWQEIAETLKEEEDISFDWIGE